MTPLRILARPAFANAALNPYNATIYKGLDAHGVRVAEYNPLRALLFGADAVHVHWPESTFNHRLIDAIPTTETLLFVLRTLRRRGTRVMWTVHNLRAHERRYPTREANFWRRYIDLVDGFITLQSGALDAIYQRFPPLRRRPHWVVPHPHYRGRYADTLSRDQARAQLGIAKDAKVITFFGRVYEYKNVPALLDAFAPLIKEDAPHHLIIAGSPRHPGIAEALQTRAAANPRIQLHLRFIPDDEAQVFFRAADVVALPYREILNSGSALLALSFDRPVLLPRSFCSDELQDRVSSDWISTFETLDATALTRALQRAETLPEHTDGEHLRAYDPDVVAAASAAALRELCQRPPQIWRR